MLHLGLLFNDGEAVAKSFPKRREPEALVDALDLLDIHLCRARRRLWRVHVVDRLQDTEKFRLVGRRGRELRCDRRGQGVGLSHRIVKRASELVESGEQTLTELLRAGTQLRSYDFTSIRNVREMLDEGEALRERAY